MRNKRNDELSVEGLMANIRSAGYDWEPGKTALSALSTMEQDLRLGLEVPPSAMEEIATAIALDSEEVAYAPKSDWRSKNGSNWVAPIRDQESCGSCVSFATVATIEAQARIQYTHPAWGLDLSEADLFFCGAGKRCSKGWWPTHALEYAKSKGISDEACFPYVPRDVHCTLCGDKVDRHLKIGSWTQLNNISKRKQWLDDKGPLVACMAVYRDFFNYKSGIYRHVTGDRAGYHAICCIGYDEEQECWICKNSWGDDWGDSGFFRIGYGEADIDTRFAMYGVEEIGGTLQPDANGNGTAMTCKSITIALGMDGGSATLILEADGVKVSQEVSDDQLRLLSPVLMGADSIQFTTSNGEIAKITTQRDL